jgi:ATPase family associated with various cellular activities (AAA)/Ribulose bisphosphate carboxylase/oxygenase activase, AAA, helical
MMSSIASRFTQALSLHLISNFRPSVMQGSPLMLGVQGPPGEGKTYQTEQVLAAADVHAVLLSGGELESPDAGMPAAKIRAAYIQASTLLDQGRPAALLLNDADAAIGSWGALTQYTVNTQNLVTELMHLADYPNHVEGQSTRRVPIILTGNDFTRLYGPLRRPGRMRIFTWQMDPYERAQAIASIFPALSPHEVEQLVKQFPDQPIAFWASIRRDVDEDAILKSVNKYGLRELTQSLIRGAEIRSNGSLCGFEQIIEFARIADTARAHGYLEQ